MKIWLHDVDPEIIVASSNQERKLKRTVESGHSYEGDIVFENADEMKKWLEEDELYED